MDGVGRTPTGRAIAAAVGSRFGVGNSTYHFGTESQVVDHLPFGAYPVVLLPAWGRLGRESRGQRGLRARLPAAQGWVPAAFDPSISIMWHCRFLSPSPFGLRGTGRCSGSGSRPMKLIPVISVPWHVQVQQALGSVGPGGGRRLVWSGVRNRETARQDRAPAPSVIIPRCLTLICKTLYPLGG